ncbi:TPA: sigma-54-dependent Fis family transcriptional regulator [bacterium]|nr:sigma-54-dependent Fis family transcriptional regulator [bacterium]
MQEDKVILIVDDEPSVRSSLKAVLEDEGFKAFAVSSGEEALEQIPTLMPDVVLLDVLMPGGIDGLETLSRIKASNFDTIVIMVSAHGNIDMAVRAMELGAIDFIEKPLSVERMLIRLEQAVEKKKLQTENMMLKKEIDERYQIIGESPVMRDLFSKIMYVAPSNSRVIIFGENGTGKELVARAIHKNSKRADKPFFQVNCAAIPDELIESELFGHEKGSFTGAVSRTQGKFEQANGATLFLDEIGDMSLRTQAKVLKVIEEQEFSRIGGKDQIRVDVRIIAATNKDLKKEVEQGRFREDLFYRLNVIPIYVPPLRERIEDIPLLVTYFLIKFSVENGVKEKRISQSAMKALQSYRWAGNVRELKNLIERLVIMVNSDTIEVADLPSNVFDRSKPLPFVEQMDLKNARNEFEKDFIIQVLESSNWNITEASQKLGIERTNLHRKIRQYNIDKRKMNKS